MLDRDFYSFATNVILCDVCARDALFYQDSAELVDEEGPMQCDNCLYQNEAYEKMGYDHDGVWHDWWE